ncbi:CRISPR type I-E-associated protein CasB/Cse2 [Prauserella shujinwangii]|uniref:CRISPR type I-E-associated protein CasB/Cse2 n=1 Tax=Prauserella shujinwangii TaxID=1453103 RepID=A0A2T0LKV8_9PSEU|nr:type I-E CRISPR-associated protein Cse2/CasB [Prauserella shujinwangii]PRX43583.1 CRISPR type I-E-associated protein CasB/Cse2 [Prauserella shujinwangii]
MTHVAELPPVHQRRQEFVKHLERLAHDLSSGTDHRIRAARRTLAQLRRSATGQLDEHEALALVFEHHAPRQEERIWLTVAGLFALNPRIDGHRLRLGAALGELERRQPRGTAQKRLRQLLAADTGALPQHLRTTLQLLANHDIRVDFYTLLDDAVTLLDPHHDEQRGRDIRWRWARDFHQRRNRKADNNASQENDE